MDLAAWMALAYRSALPTAEQLRIALGDGPRREDFPADVVAREEADLAALEERDVRLLPIADPSYPARLRAAGGPLLLQVAGRAALLEEDGVEVLAGHRGAAGQRLHECVEGAARAIVVLSKGLLKSDTLLRALREPLVDGAVALVSGEPPRAAWGPVRDRRRAAIVEALQSPR